VFVDGKPQNIHQIYQGKSKSIGWFSEVMDQNNPNSYYLGVYRRPGEEKRHFTGAIKSFKIYNRNLSFEDINKKHFTKKELYKDLVLSYDFDLKNQSFLNYVKSLLSMSFIDQAGQNGENIPFNAEAKKTIEFHALSVISLILLVLLILFLSRKGSNLFIIPNNYIKGFDGLRGISILLVIITHL